MRIAIVDDEPAAAQGVEALCAQWAEENHTGLLAECFSSGEALLDSFAPGRFSLVFLDIYMGGINGVDTARRLRQADRACLLVFLTTSREHMAQAFPCHAFDYVEKPAGRERIFAVLNDATAVLPQLERYIELPGGQTRLRPESLVSAESDGNYLSICMADGRILRQRMTFREFSNLLEGDPRFISTIRGVILNMDFIDDLQGGRCTMKTGAIFPVKLRDSAEMEAALNRYRFDCLRSRQEGGLR